MIKDSGNHAPMGPTGFVRSNGDGKGRMDLLPWNAILELSKHCEEGAKVYGERNIDKGAPLHSLLDSGARHLAKVMLDHQDEDHLRAAAWNIMWALEQRTTHPELDDMPKNVVREPESPPKNVTDNYDTTNEEDVAGVPENSYLSEAEKVAPDVICPVLACGALGCPGDIFYAAPRCGGSGCAQTKGNFVAAKCVVCWRADYRGEEVARDAETV